MIGHGRTCHTRIKELENHLHHGCLLRLRSETVFGDATEAVGRRASWWPALPDALLTALPESLDNIFTVFFGDRLADLANQHIAAVVTVVEGHIRNEDADAKAFEFPKEVLGNADISGEPVERGNDNRRNFAVLAGPQQ